MKDRKKEEVIAVASNRKAFHSYHITDTYEAGLSLTGAEVKSLRAREVSMEQSFARLDGGQAYIHNLHIQPYRFDHNPAAHAPDRARRLLLNRAELKKLSGLTAPSP